MCANVIMTTFEKCVKNKNIYIIIVQQHPGRYAFSLKVREEKSRDIIYLRNFPWLMKKSWVHFMMDLTENNDRMCKI